MTTSVGGAAALDPSAGGQPADNQGRQLVLSAVVTALALFPAAVRSWPLPSVLALLPTLTAALMVIRSDVTARTRSATVVLGSCCAVLPAVPGALGVAELVEPGLDAWLWRGGLTMPLFVAIVALDAEGVATVARRPLTWWYALAGWALLTSPWAAEPAGSALAAAEMGVLAVVVSWSVSVLSPRASISTVGVGVAAFCAVSVAAELLGADIPLVFTIDNPTGLGFSRVSGFAGEPIQLAEAGGVAAVCVIATASVRRFRHLGLTDWLVLGVGIVTIASSQSRAALAGVVAAAAWMMLRRSAPRFVAVIAAVFGFVILVVALTGIGPAGLVAAIDVRGDSDGSNGRIDSVWPAALDGIEDRPLTGWGIAGTETALREAMEEGEVPRMLARNAHNRWLEVALALGIVGLVLFAMIAVDMAGIVRSPGIEALLVYLLIVGITGPGSGVMFGSADDLLLITVLTILGTRSGLESDSSRRRETTAAYLDRQLFG